MNFFSTSTDMNHKVCADKAASLAVRLFQCIHHHTLRISQIDSKIISIRLLYF